MSAPRRALLTGAALLAAFGPAACVSPAWDDHDYALKAGKTAEAAASAVQLARTAVRHEDGTTRQYLKVVLTEAADDLGNVNDQFGGVQPPSDASERLRGEVTDLTEKAEDEVHDLLDQVRRDRVRDPAGAVRDLGEIAGRLSAFAERHK
ncbi:hypothetical protein GCM10009530_28480 [Microbispora corallina]|uniref:Uncharacterized protein n=1 Tax=Microbispora corallina TaxID=83302 RepID=A0ABQ4FZU6_9ACTN|nr:hypothetical protein [Microbispora corallina]GIH40233.1 hypothetical protein Mco01_32330 [Microbispora corallina]